MYSKPHKTFRWAAALLAAALLPALWPAISGAAMAQSPLHPDFPLLDEDGMNVLQSGAPLSTMQTCGACHDTAFIQSHSYHSAAGWEPDGGQAGLGGGYPWDSSAGWFGAWNPITYRYLSQPGDALLDLGTADWLRTAGLRHVGGGPALYSRTGKLLSALTPQPGDPETSVLDETSGESTSWDWMASGGVEMNCFLCHLSSPDNESRQQALLDGEFRWANSATLLASGVISKQGAEWVWNRDAFDSQGALPASAVGIQDPDSQNCGLCHGLVVDEDDLPPAYACLPETWNTQTSGQLISPQRISDSGMNLANKDGLTRAWDVHAERLLECSDCHYSPNNPVYGEGSGEDSLEHLEFDPRRLELGSYLERPSHDFARVTATTSGDQVQVTASMRICQDCHQIEKSHAWLPYSQQHIDALACETCHVPQLYASAIKQVDWTAVQLDGTALTACRGVEGHSGTIRDLVTGFTPVLLPRLDADGRTRLAPYNLLSAWYWVYGDPPRPVRQIDLEAAWLENGGYATAVLEAFDHDRDGSLSKEELAIDSSLKENLIAARLQALGLEKPHIEGSLEAYSINHGVAGGEWAIRDCQVCHSEESLLAAPVQLADYLPGGVVPEIVAGARTSIDGELREDCDGALFYEPTAGDGELYILGHSSVSWVDWTGAVFFLATLGAVVTHGGLRTWNARRRPQHDPELERIYMYTFYERLWHWLQTLAILILLLTGLVIHKPDMFAFMSFRGVVAVHNIVSAVLVANAALALFYNLVSGDIQRFIPRPQGFFNQAIVQVKYYLRGIFKGAQHPFEKTREDRLNPLQKITYFGILNVLLPAQVLTGLLMWGRQLWPQLSEALGGLVFLGPLHSLVAWLFAAFIVAHVYLTTTTQEPLAGIRAMMMGWDEVQVPAPSEE